MDERVLWNVSYGLYALTVMDKERATGCIVNTVVQITSQNPVIAVSLSKDNYTTKVLDETKRFAVSILSQDVPRNTIAMLGFASGRDKDKFQAIEHHFVEGLPVPSAGNAGVFVCEVIACQEMETHNVYFARVTQTCAGEGIPMTYAYYHQVMKGKAPKNAPTFRTVSA